MATDRVNVTSADALRSHLLETPLQTAWAGLFSTNDPEIRSHYFDVLVEHLSANREDRRRVTRRLSALLDGVLTGDPEGDPLADTVALANRPVVPLDLDTLLAALAPVLTASETVASTPETVETLATLLVDISTTSPRPAPLAGAMPAAA
ncbi:MAG: hypothetical protein H6525_07435 [Actinobacteria bacterium]|nr:hypothetical protein [Actinomycetota bacterium]MCB9412661.1 hypothetical protein [Actinomycetota bacterium]